MPGSVALTDIGKECVLRATTDKDMRLVFKNTIFGSGATAGSLADPTVKNLVAPKIQITGFLTSNINAIVGNTVTWVIGIPADAKQFIPSVANPPSNVGSDGAVITSRIDLTEVGIIADLEKFDEATKTWSVYSPSGTVRYENLLVIYNVLDEAVPYTPGNDTNYQITQTVDSKITPTNMVLTDDATAIGVAFRTIIEETFGAYVPVPVQLYLNGEDIQLYPGRLYHIIGSTPFNVTYPNRTKTIAVLPPATEIITAARNTQTSTNTMGSNLLDTAYYVTPNASRRLLILDPLGYLSPDTALQLRSNDGILINGDQTQQTDMLVNTPYKAMDITLCSISPSPGSAADPSAQQDSYYMVNFSELHTSPNIDSGVSSHDMDALAHYGSTLLPNDVRVSIGGNATGSNGSPINKFTLEIGKETMLHPLGLDGTVTLPIELTLPKVDINTEYAYTKITALSPTFPTSRSTVGGLAAAADLKISVVTATGDGASYPNTKIRFYNGANDITGVQETGGPIVLPAHVFGSIKFVYVGSLETWYAFPEWRKNAAPLIKGWKYFKGDKVDLYGRTYVCTLLGMANTSGVKPASVSVNKYKSPDGTSQDPTNMVYDNIFGSVAGASPATIIVLGNFSGGTSTEKHFLNAFTLIG